MNYCSKCGSEKISFIVPEGDNRPRFCCQNCGTIHYSNPKMVVGCLPYYGDKILLCRRAIEPRKGYWGLPAGYLENKETIEDGALRETHEEAGVSVELGRMHCVYSIPRISQIYIFFLAEMKSPEINIGEETLEAGLYLPEEIPYEQMAFPSSVFALKKYFQDLASGFQGVHIGKWDG